jgi:arginase family enzyme
MSDYPTLFGCAMGGDGDIIVLGVPYDRGTDSYRSGCANGPSVLRTLSEQLRMREAALYDLSRRQTLLAGDTLSDLGNLRFYPHQTDQEYLGRVAQGVQAIASSGKKPLLLGGDHLVTLHALRGLKNVKPAFQVVQLDAHHDYSTINSGERPTHATFMGYVAAERLARQVLQIGVRGLTWGAPERPEAVSSVTLEQLHSALIPGLDVYVTVDTDAFDPSIAPGVGYPEPDGLPLAALARALAGIREAGCAVIGADWTEYNPQYDTAHHLTGRVALRGLALLLEGMSS